MLNVRVIVFGAAALLSLCAAEWAWSQDARPPSGQTGSDAASENRETREAPGKTHVERPAAAKRADPKSKQVRKEEKRIEAPASPAPEVPPAATPGLVAPQTNGEPTGEFEPVLQARKANVTTCMDKIVALSGRVIDRPHRAISTFVQAAPNDHVFQSIIGLNYPSKVVPNGTAIIIAAPINSSQCEGESVQVYPTTSSCTAVQASLISNGRTLTSLETLPLIETKDGNRQVLMPTAGGGCVIISVGLR